MRWPSQAARPARASALRRTRLTSTAAAYRLLDAGNVEAAERAFTARVSSAPDDAAAEFGVLYAEHARLDVDDSIEPTFARQLDAFVDRMDKRHGDHPEDADALRYLAQAYMLRAAYRYEGNQGMWGAAHDAAHARDRIDQYQSPPR